MITDGVLSGWERITMFLKLTFRPAQTKVSGRFNRATTVFMVLSAEKQISGIPTLPKTIMHIEPPYGPEEGYHLSKDLADQAIKMISDQKSANPSKPWFMWYNPGANHAPHQAPKEYIAKV
ncbi:MAG: sulfatase-like hydrolase/transferase [Marinilabiliales bacterium]|nr:sulfatase-like hydrolase/transferase [Marinilabiliales bacterium]